jgi:hypothetical protein
MKYVLIETQEPASRRFNKLCRDLNANAPGEKQQLLGHLCSWFMHWAGLNELEAGLWFGISLKEIGSWAEVSGKDADQWGHALQRAGYVKSIRDVYPDPLGSQQTGWVAVTIDGNPMLDNAMLQFGRSKNAATYAPYILDRTRRIKFACDIRLDTQALIVAGTVPKDWFTPSQKQPTLHGASEPPHTNDACTQLPPPAVNAPHPHARAPAASTGKPKSSAMYEIVRKNKYVFPMVALRALDDTPKAMNAWKKALAADRAAVCQILAEMTESEAAWEGIVNPAALAMSRLKRLCQNNR